MKKIFIIGSLLLSSLVADNFLGTPITSYNGTLKPTKQTKSYNKNVDNPPIQKKSPSHKKFKKDDHRYDKRYSSFDYETHGYYSDDDYYYGYYDTRGYFYNNIFFTYNNRYTYYDRHHHLGYFRPSYQHHRVYEYHVINDWNRVHCYREPNQIVYEYYDDRPSYNPYRSSYYDNSHRYYGNQNNRYPNYRGNTRMSTNRNSYSREHSSHNYNNNYRSDDTKYNDYRNSNHNSYQNRNQYRRSDTRMRTRSYSSSHRSNSNHHSDDKSTRGGSTHMQLSR